MINSVDKGLVMGWSSKKVDGVTTVVFEDKASNRTAFRLLASLPEQDEISIPHKALEEMGFTTTTYSKIGQVLSQMHTIPKKRSK